MGPLHLRLRATYENLVSHEMFIHKFCASWCFTKSYKGNAHNLERWKQKINQIGITTWSIHVNFILIYVIYSMTILISDMGLEMNERKEKQYILASGGLLSILCPIKSKWWSNDSVQSISIALRLWSNMAKKSRSVTSWFPLLLAYWVISYISQPVWAVP